MLEVAVVFNLPKMNGQDDHDSWLNNWEQQCAEAIENQPDYDQSLAQENEVYQRRVWTSFQESATAIAQLYRGTFLVYRLYNSNSFLCVRVCEGFLRKRAFIFSSSFRHF